MPCAPTPGTGSGGVVRVGGSEARPGRGTHWVELATRILAKTLVGRCGAGRRKIAARAGLLSWLVICALPRRSLLLWCRACVRGWVCQSCRLTVVWVACSLAVLCFVVLELLPSLAVPGLCSFLRVTQHLLRNSFIDMCAYGDSQLEASEQ